MDDEELAKLMREIDQFDGKTAGTPPAAAPSPGTAAGREVAPTESQSGGKGKWIAFAAGGSGVVGLFVGSFFWFIPYVNGPATAVGAALGGALAAVVGQPPRWLR